MLYNASGRPRSPRDARARTTASSAVRRLCEEKDAAGAGVVGEFFREETKTAKKNMPTVVDPRFIFVAGGDFLVNP